MSVGGNSEIFVTVRVEPSDYFRREGYDVHTDANISLSQALLGGIIRIQVIFYDMMPSEIFLQDFRILLFVSMHYQFIINLINTL